MNNSDLSKLDERHLDDLIRNYKNELDGKQGLKESPLLPAQRAIYQKKILDIKEELRKRSLEMENEN